MDDKTNPEVPELPKSFILIQFDDMGSVRMTVQVGGIVPAQIAVAAWYLAEQSKVMLYQQMEQQAKIEQTKHIVMPNAKY